MSGVVVYDYYASGLIGIDISTPGGMAMASYKYIIPNNRKRNEPPKVTIGNQGWLASEGIRGYPKVPCLTDIFVDRYLPPTTAKAVQHPCPTTVPRVTRYTF
jgi:hypothetical protein